MSKKPATVEDRSVGEFKTCPTVVLHGEGRAFSDGYYFHVHAAGCADLTKRREYRALDGLYGQNVEDYYEVTSMKDVVDAEYGPGAGSFYEESGLDPEDPTNWEGYRGEFHVFPCVELPNYPVRIEPVAEVVAEEPKMTAEEALDGLRAMMATRGLSDGQRLGALLAALEVTA